MAFAHSQLGAEVAIFEHVTPNWVRLSFETPRPIRMAVRLPFGQRHVAKPRKRGRQRPSRPIVWANVTWFFKDFASLVLLSRIMCIELLMWRES